MRTAEFITDEETSELKSEQVFTFDDGQTINQFDWFDITLKSGPTYHLQCCEIIGDCMWAEGDGRRLQFYTSGKILDLTQPKKPQ